MHKQEVKNQCGPKLGLFNNLVNLSNSSHGKRGEQIKKKKACSNVRSESEDILQMSKAL